MPSSRLPRLRSGLQASPLAGSTMLQLSDGYRVATPLKLSRSEIELAQLLNGQRSAVEIASLARMIYANEADVATIERVAQRLDQAGFLDSPMFAERLRVPIRPPSCIGCYPADPEGIRVLFDALFQSPEGPGLPDPPGSHIDNHHPAVRAVLLPHIDYARGNVSYAWGGRSLVERSDARLFVIIGTSHYSPHRFTLTRQHFQTPLGTVETDARAIDHLVSTYGDGLFEDPLAHWPEHSIELEVVLLQYLFRDRPIRILPLLVGSFHDCIGAEVSPAAQPDIQRMILALQQLEAQIPEPITYVISGDLAHIGPKFGDPAPVDDQQLARCLTADQQLIAHASQGDPEAYFRQIAAEEDGRRICGLPPTYLTLMAAKPARGSLLHYGRYVHPHGHESVSFASMAFERA